MGKGCTGWFAFARGLAMGTVALLSWSAGAGAQVVSEFATPTPSSQPLFIAAGSDGALWFTEFSANKIGRITTAGTITEFPVPTNAANPAGITAGSDGALWFAEENGNNIARITTYGAITEFPIPTGASFPIGIAAGPDGAL